MPVLFKRIIVITVMMVALFIILIYVFIPDTLTIHNTAIINCNVAAASRTINNSWKDIFYRCSDTAFYVDDYRYKIIKPVYNGSHISINRNKSTYYTVLSLLSLSSDTLLLQWDAKIETSKYPLPKVIAYFKAKALRNNMDKVITRLQSYLSKVSHVYGYNIFYTTLTDTVLISVKTITDTYPSIQDIYMQIDKLEKYINTYGAKITNSPMLNVTRANNKYILMVGLPINMEIPSKNKMEIKHLLLIKDKTLTAKIQGGLGIINDAHKQIETYMQDHSLIAPVISFDLLITNRIKQTNSAKWITQLYYPID